MKQKLFVFFSFLFITHICTAQRRGLFKDPHFIITPSYPINLERELEVFNDGNKNALYRIIICADVPNNKKPMHLMYQMETGHVFLILQKLNAADTITKVFGFYPATPGLVVFVKKEVKSIIKDNSNREHDIELSKMISKDTFENILKLSVEYSKKNYHLNNFNCYDYAVRIFNAAAAPDTLPIIYRRFAFFGKGGSPCSVYKYLLQQKQLPGITVGNLIAPVSTKIKGDMARMQ